MVLLEEVIFIVPIFNVFEIALVYYFILQGTGAPFSIKMFSN